MRQQINVRLGSYTCPPDMNSLRTNLTALRNLSADTADFSITQASWRYRVTGSWAGGGVG